MGGRGRGIGRQFLRPRRYVFAVTRILAVDADCDDVLIHEDTLTVVAVTGAVRRAK